MANGCSFPYLTTALVVAALLSGIRAWQNQCGHSPQTVSARTYITGVIESPNYPNQYPNNKNCQWKIVARQGYVVRLYVVDMDLEEDSYCIYDSVSIFDGGSKMNHSRLVKICGQNYQYHNFYSTGRYMYIDFTSDGSVTKRGFQLRYKAIASSRSNYSSSSTTTTTTTTTPWSSSGQCHSSMTDPLRASLGVTRSIYSPNYPNLYPSNSNCGWKIEASWGYIVRLYVAHIDLEGSDDCTFDSVSVFDGERPLYSSLRAELCHLSDQGRIFYSNGRYMFVSFTSDGSVSRSGFQLNYRAVLKSPGDYDSTTTRPWWHRTTTADRYRSTYRHNSGALIGGVSAGLAVGLALLFAIVLLCRRRIKQSRNRPHAGMPLAMPTLNPVHAAGMAYQNNAVFMMPNVGYVSPTTGYNNFGYSPYWDGLPAYSTLLPNTYLQPGGVAGPSDATTAPSGEATEPAEPSNTTAAQPSEPIGPSNAMAAQPDKTDGPPNTIAAQPGSPAGLSNTMAAQLGVPAMPSNAMAAQPSTQAASAPPAYSDALMDSHPPATPNSE